MIRHAPLTFSLLVSILLVSVLLTATSAQGKEHRYALVVGVNEGDASEVELHFAERDAVRMADVLTRVGGVASEDLILMRGAEAEDVIRALQAVRRRIAERRKPGDGAVLFVYYSGHASAGEAHLRGTRLAFDKLNRLVKASGAELAVMVMDACRSGDLTRVKGGVTTKPFEITVSDALETAGLAIISSSAAGEDAQESDRLRGGIFTHHLLTGMLGAADANRDRQVTLSEAYRYAHTETVRATSRTRFVQHPTYSFRLKGRKELVMTRMGAAPGFGRLRLTTPGSYVVMERDAGGRVVAELAASRQTEVLIAPGIYLVRRREPSAVYERVVTVGRSAAAEVAGMARIPYGRTVRKGLATERELAVGLTASGELGGPMLEGFSLAGFASLGVRLDLPAITLEPRLRFGRSTADADPALTTVSTTQDAFGVDLGIYKVFDLPRVPLGLGLGLRLGGDWIWQRFDTTGHAPDRSQWVWRLAPTLRFEAALHPNVGLTLDGGVDFHLGDFVNTATGAAEFGARFVPFGALGLVVYLP